MGFNSVFKGLKAFNLRTGCVCVRVNL